MAITIQDSFRAAAVVGLDGLLNPVFASQSGDFAPTIVKNGIGDYTITLSPGLDTSQTITIVQPYNATQVQASVERPSDGTIRVRTFGTDGPADSGFGIRIDRFV